MDGSQLKRSLRDLLNESSTAAWMNDKTTYEYLNQAAVEFALRTSCLRSTQTIYTLALTPAYRLNADFVDVYLQTDQNAKYVRLNDGTTDRFITQEDYSSLVYRNNATASQFPDRFSITDDDSPPPAISGTASADGAVSAGQAVLNDGSAPFADVSIGDMFHNTTTGASGYVLAVTSTSVLSTAIFNAAVTASAWTSGDGYELVPQGGRYNLVFDPPPSVSAYTVTVPYIQKPHPVYSDYGVFRFPNEYTPTLVRYAFWLYKYRDSQPNFGDKMYVAFDNDCKRFGYQVAKRLGRSPSSVRVNLKVRR